MNLLTLVLQGVSGRWYLGWGREGDLSHGGRPCKELPALL